jgi:hypothetical protein
MVVIGGLRWIVVVHRRCWMVVVNMRYWIVVEGGRLRWIVRVRCYRAVISRRAAWSIRCPVCRMVEVWLPGAIVL